MTQLLVSVRSVEEARAALAGGADWIDVKEPARGALGRADGATIAAIVREVAGRRPVSVALGELTDLPSRLDLDWEGIHAAKIGLAGTSRSGAWQARWLAVWELIPPSLMRVAAAYADWWNAQGPHPAEVLAWAAQANCGALLIDTWDKTSGDLLAHLTLEQIAALREECRRHRLQCVLAGSLQGDSLSRVVSLAPDLVGVRGAACRGGRNGAVAEPLVREIVRVVRRSATSLSALAEAT